MKERKERRKGKERKGKERKGKSDVSITQPKER
jgi:hypothetical protein